MSEYVEMGEFRVLLGSRGELGFRYVMEYGSKCRLWRFRVLGLFVLMVFCERWRVY